MTEFEYNRRTDKLEEQMNHRRDVCADCEYNKTPPDDDSEHFCCCDDGTNYCYELSELMTAPDGFCDAWGEDGDNAPTLTPIADYKFYNRMCKTYRQAQKAEIAYDVAHVKGFCVNDINRYVEHVNTFCEKLTELLNVTNGKLSVRDVMALEQGADALVEMSRVGGRCG